MFGVLVMGIPRSLQAANLFDRDGFVQHKIVDPFCKNRVGAVGDDFLEQSHLPWRQWRATGSFMIIKGSKHDLFSHEFISHGHNKNIRMLHQQACIGWFHRVPGIIGDLVAVQTPSPQPSPARGEGARESVACATEASAASRGSERLRDLAYLTRTIQQSSHFFRNKPIHQPQKTSAP